MTEITESADPKIQELSFEPQGHQMRLGMVLFLALSPESLAGDLTPVFPPQMCFPKCNLEGHGAHRKHSRGGTISCPLSWSESRGLGFRAASNF